jgi:hypothetical protein
LHKYHEESQTEFHVVDAKSKMTIIKSLRVNSTIMDKINTECKALGVDFSDYMRCAALAMNKKTSDPKSLAHERWRKISVTRRLLTLC